jgi:small GTP-binding protein
LNIDGKVIRAEIWDTAGQERYRSMSPSFYRGSVGALIVYDVTNKESFESIPKWIKEIHTHAEGIIATLIIGNKSDRTDRAVLKENANELASRNKCGLIETSAMNDVNVEQAFEVILRNIVQTVIKTPENNFKVVDTARTKKIERRDSLPQQKKCTCCGSG